MDGEASGAVRVKKKAKKKQFKGRKERLQARNEALLQQLKVDKETNEGLVINEKKILKENELLKRRCSALLANCRGHSYISISKACTRATHHLSAIEISSKVQQSFLTIKQISNEELYMADEKIGQGVFGVCHAGSLGPLKVCAKVFRSACLCEPAFEYEAALLSNCSHTNIPWLYGVVMQPSKVIVMSYHAIAGNPLTLHKALYSQSSTLTLTNGNWKIILLGVASALKYIHSMHILHNDIKGDNIILESYELSYRSLLVDFGKGCFFGDARLYSLSKEQKEVYAKQHPQVAPEVRDGRIKQGVYSDVYSFVRVINQVNENVLKISELSKYCSKCIHSNYLDRPTSLDVQQFLSSLSV